MAATISDVIEKFLLETLGGSEIIQISRNELANYFSCAPSQINYVLSTRFTVDRGFIVESRRGGGGYITVVRTSGNIHADLLKELLGNILNVPLSYQRVCHIIDRLVAEEIVTKREGRLMRSAVSDRAVAIVQPERNLVRSNILASVLHELVKEKETDVM